MRKTSAAAAALALFLWAGGVLAQDTTPSPSGSAGAIGTGAAGKGMAMQDCRNRAKAAKGDKGNETPTTFDADRTCADMTKKGGVHKKAMKGTAASASM